LGGSRSSRELRWASAVAREPGAPDEIVLPTVIGAMTMARRPGRQIVCRHGRLRYVTVTIHLPERGRRT
jgi:hypothetical protein